MNSFVYSNFTTRKGINNIEKVQERSLKFILNDYDKTYFQLLDISKKPSMEVKRLRILITEIFKTLNDSNPVFMKDIFHYCQNKSHKKHNLHVHSRNISRYGNNSLRVRGVHVRNSLPENMYELKDVLKGWYGLKCHLYSSYILKTAKRQFYYMIMRRYFSRMHQKKGSGRSLGVDPFFRDGLCFFLFFTCILFYNFDFVYY